MDDTPVFRGTPGQPGYLVTAQVNQTRAIICALGIVLIPTAIRNLTNAQRSFLEPHIITYIIQAMLQCIPDTWPTWFKDHVRNGVLLADHRLPLSMQLFYRRGIAPAFRRQRALNLTDFAVLRCLTLNRIGLVEAKLHEIGCEWMLLPLDLHTNEAAVTAYSGTPQERVYPVDPVSVTLESVASAGTSTIPNMEGRRDPLTLPIYKVYQSGAVTVTHGFLDGLEFVSTREAMGASVDKIVVYEGFRTENIDGYTLEAVAIGGVTDTALTEQVIQGPDGGEDGVQTAEITVVTSIMVTSLCRHRHIDSQTYMQQAAGAVPMPAPPFETATQGVPNNVPQFLPAETAQPSDVAAAEVSAQTHGENDAPSVNEPAPDTRHVHWEPEPVPLPLPEFQGRSWADAFYIVAEDVGRMLVWMMLIWVLMSFVVQVIETYFPHRGGKTN